MKRPIGVLDSGIGGLTVATSIQKLMPNEDIVYIGDSKNVPYGNRTEEEIFDLSMAMFGFLEKRDVKMVAIACNTISTISHLFKGKFNLPVIDIVTSTVSHIYRMGVKKVAVFATEFTIRTGAYERLLRDKNPNIEIFNESSKTLATLIDNGDFDSNDTYETVKRHLDSIKGMGEIYNLILACTHYPIVEDVFLDIDPSLNYINPGFQQAKEMRAFLNGTGSLERTGSGSIRIYTSGNIGIYEKAATRLKIKGIEELSSMNLTTTAK